MLAARTKSIRANNRCDFFLTLACVARVFIRMRIISECVWIYAEHIAEEPLDVLADWCNGTRRKTSESVRDQYHPNVASGARATLCQVQGYCIKFIIPGKLLQPN